MQAKLCLFLHMFRRFSLLGSHGLTQGHVYIEIFLGRVRGAISPSWPLAPPLDAVYVINPLQNYTYEIYSVVWSLHFILWSFSHVLCKENKRAHQLAIRPPLLAKLESSPSPLFLLMC